MKLKKLVYRAQVTEIGTFHLSAYNKQRMRSEMKERFSGKNVRLVIEEDSAEKTTDQLGYFYGVILPYVMYGLIMKGNEIQIDNKEHEKEIENWLKKRYLKNGIELIIDDEVDTTPSSLARADKNQVIEFMNKVIKFCNEDLHITVPEPDKNWKINKLGITQKHFLIEKLNVKQK